MLYFAVQYDCHDYLGGIMQYAVVVIYILMYIVMCYGGHYYVGCILHYAVFFIVALLLCNVLWWSNLCLKLI